MTGAYKNMLLGVVSLTFRCHAISGDPKPPWRREVNEGQDAEVFSLDEWCRRR
ncbi:hypothetical protein OG884_10740 [Streptosporangium sp. NBC_01755]|uniref:hypothetical protein n=1 Tax=unclassified Streptosporangium TaxID=2632669 RepID=UPI002DDB3BBE|nr:MULTISPECIES: hypothetical protein [unclassified Streptosporangium]WSA26216.1 hypothetical protein OIE13_35945 [Streptosporangium sp. NBC_01810]WSD02356.1 hypothetical protein OG884_10740 [Streptosporangium sp. NBC_01755]